MENEYYNKIQSYIRHLCIDGRYGQIAEYDYIGFWKDYIITTGKLDIAENPIFTWKDKKAEAFAIKMAKKILSYHAIKGTVLEVNPVLFFYTDSVGNIHYMRWEDVDTKNNSRRVEELMESLGGILSTLKDMSFDLPIPADELAFRSEGYEFRYSHKMSNIYSLDSITKIKEE